MLVWGRGTCFENKNTLRKRGRVWEIALSHKIQKSARWKMTLTEFKPTLRLILKLFSMIFGGFSVQGGGLGGYRILFHKKGTPPCLGSTPV